jgi:UDP-3-O-[3-hydroxymyristoyl] glucosamine N-acyltransferase
VLYTLQNCMAYCRGVVGNDALIGQERMVLTDRVVVGNDGLIGRERMVLTDRGVVGNDGLIGRERNMVLTDGGRCRCRLGLRSRGY